jgi:hypothetical protein
MSWFRRLMTGVRWDGTVGPPRSSNAASSFHLAWEAPTGPWIGAEVVLEVNEPPIVPSLYFWALQVSFEDRGRAAGGAHFGLQWYPPHPGSTAINWGGYAPDGGELTGTQSLLASATRNPNTRDFAWKPRTRYRLSVARGHRTPDDRWAWRAEITDLQSGERTHVRDLISAGSTLTAPMVWSEVFADCDAPSAVVHWSQLAVVGVDGERRRVDAARVNYQAVADGGCTRTNSSVVGGVFEQRTTTPRTTPQGSRLQLSRS